MKEDVMEEACSTHRGVDKRVKILSEIVKERDYLGDGGVDGRIILKGVLKTGYDDVD
jgi:hypothetical protein